MTRLKKGKLYQLDPHPLCAKASITRWETFDHIVESHSAHGIVNNGMFGITECAFIVLGSLTIGVGSYGQLYYEILYGDQIGYIFADELISFTVRCLS